MENNDQFIAAANQLISKQMSVLGPDITMAKVKHISEIELDGQGRVVSISGNPQEVLKKLINQFVELSGLIVKKTMESIIVSQSESARTTTTQVMQQAHNEAPATSAASSAPGTGTEEVVKTLNEALAEMNMNKVNTN